MKKILAFYSNKALKEMDCFAKKTIKKVFEEDYVNTTLSMANLANSGFLYFLGGCVAVFITVFSVFFMVKSYKAALASGIDKKTIHTVIKSSCVFTIIPSIAILLGLVTMAGGLGVPLSWIRLSVVGAVQYELIAADAAASSANIPALLLEYLTPEVFVSIATVMTVCILSGLVFNIFFLKKYLSGIRTMQQKDNKWGRLVVASMFMGMICTFLGTPIIDWRLDPNEGWMSLSVMFVSAVAMFVCDILVKRYKAKSLEGFSLPLSMIMGMLFAMLISSVLGLGGV